MRRTAQSCFETGQHLLELLMSTHTTLWYEERRI